MNNLSSIINSIVHSYWPNFIDAHHSVLEINRESIDFEFNVRDIIKEECVEFPLQGQEILYGFCGWLTTRPQRTVMSCRDECSVIVDLIAEFSKVNELAGCRYKWERHLIRPKE